MVDKHGRHTLTLLFGLLSAEDISATKTTISPYTDLINVPYIVRTDQIVLQGYISTHHSHIEPGDPSSCAPDVSGGTYGGSFARGSEKVLSTCHYVAFGQEPKADGGGVDDTMAVPTEESTSKMMYRPSNHQGRRDRLVAAKELPEARALRDRYIEACRAITKPTTMFKAFDNKVAYWEKLAATVDDRIEMGKVVEYCRALRLKEWLGRNSRID